MFVVGHVQKDAGPSGVAHRYKCPNPYLGAYLFFRAPVLCSTPSPLGSQRQPTELRGRRFHRRVAEVEHANSSDPCEPCDPHQNAPGAQSVTNRWAPTDNQPCRDATGQHSAQHSATEETGTPTGMGRRSCTDVRRTKARHAVGMANSHSDEVTVDAGPSGLYATRRLPNLHGLSGMGGEAGRGPGGFSHRDHDPRAHWDCGAPVSPAPSSRTESGSGAFSLSATTPCAAAIQDGSAKRRPLGPNHRANIMWPGQHHPTHYRPDCRWRGEAVMQ
jgi:hypothetical protein